MDTSNTVEDDTSKLEGVTDGWEVEDEFSEKHLVAKVAKKKHVERLPRKWAQAHVASGLYHTATQIFLGIILMLSLFLPDFWVIANPSNEDDHIYNWILILCIIFFLVEIILLCYVQADYPLSVFFWMDIVGTVSVVFDLTFVTDFIGRTGGTDTSILRVARVAKIGAKAGRLSRVTKFLKYLHFNNQNQDEDEFGLPVENVSAKLSLVLSQRVAALIMILVVVSPLISNTVIDFSGAAHALDFDNIASSGDYSDQQWLTLVEEYKAFYDEIRSQNSNGLADPVWLKVRGVNSEDCPIQNSTSNIAVSYDSIKGFCMYDFRQDRALVNNHIVRSQNKAFATSRGYPRYSGDNLCNPNVPQFSYVCKKLTYIDVLFDTTEVAVVESWSSVALIVIIIFLLVTFTAAFKFAVDDIVVNPIARIMNHINSTLDEVVLNSVNELFEDDGTDHASRQETIILEKMVHKLTKIVQSSIGAKQNELFRDGIDSNTKAWITADFVYEMHERKEVVPARQLRRPPSFGGLGEALNISTDVVNSFDLDILACEEGELTHIVYYMFEKYHLPKAFNIDPVLLHSFIEKVRSQYLTEPRYHNWFHAVDVMHTVYRFLDITHSGEFLSKQEFLSTLVAALAHDLGHLGVNNTFLVKTNHELAHLHNDVSPLENMHCSKLYEILRSPDYNIFVNLTKDQWVATRKQILTCILNTDMAYHFENLKKLEVFEEVNGVYFNEFMNNIEFGPAPVPECLQDSQNRLLLQEMFLHAADVSNPVMPLHLYEQWVERVTEEFFAQGDKEKELGMAVSPMCERATTNIPNMQLGFIEYVVAPLYMTLFAIFPRALLPLADNLQHNFTHYARERGKESPEEKEQLKARVVKFRTKIKKSGLEVEWSKDEFTEVPLTKPPKRGSNLLRSNSSFTPEKGLPHPATKGADIEMNTNNHSTGTTVNATERSEHIQMSSDGPHKASPHKIQFPSFNKKVDLDLKKQGTAM